MGGGRAGRQRDRAAARLRCDAGVVTADGGDCVVQLSSAAPPADSPAGRR